MTNTLYQTVFEWLDSYDRKQPLSLSSILVIIGDVWISKELRNRYNMVLEIDFDIKNTYDILLKSHNHTLQLFDTRSTVIYIDNVAMLESKCENDLLRLLRSGKVNNRSIPIVINILYPENIGHILRNECYTLLVDNFSICKKMEGLNIEDGRNIEYEDDARGCGDDNLTLEEYKTRLEDIIFS